MRTLFADTFYFIAFLSTTDSAHDRAVEFTDGYDGKLITTAWVLTELADGMAAPHSRRKFISFLQELRADPDIVIVPPDEKLYTAGLALYEQRADRAWSLTDCISFLVMQEAGVSEALTGDHHFEQAGFVALLR